MLVKNYEFFLILVGAPVVRYEGLTMTDGIRRIDANNVG